MRSWRELAVVAALVAGACGTDRVPEDDPEDPPIEPGACETSYLDYENFGAPFVVSWCRGCHSSQVPMGMRQMAPIDVNFDTAEDVTRWSERILKRAAGATPTMPPAGGPSGEERQLLVEWLDCGAK